jgi:16S rRNA A1518/A1519 N6-dimethyltransferase RsmA/KsgA/DIM1 with predicted DNA glycosylase/AP lyase activity
VLVRLDRRPERAGGDVDGPGSERYERLFSVVRAGFAHRRKMLRRSLDGQVRADAFDAVGIRSTARAEELSLDEWERLAAWQPAENEPMAQPAESELMAQPAENEPAGEPDQ